MTAPLSQDEINANEYQNPDNWAGLGPFKAYFSKRDSRIFAHGRPWEFSTLNYGHRFGALVLALMLLFMMFVFIGSHLKK